MPLILWMYVFLQGNFRSKSLLKLMIVLTLTVTSLIKISKEMLAGREVYITWKLNRVFWFGYPFILNFFWLWEVLFQWINLTVTWEAVLKGKSLMVQAVGICVEFLLRFRMTVDGQNVLVGHTCYMIAPRPDLMH